MNLTGLPSELRSTTASSVPLLEHQKSPDWVEKIGSMSANQLLKIPCLFACFVNSAQVNFLLGTEQKVGPNFSNPFLTYVRSNEKALQTAILERLHEINNFELFKKMLELDCRIQKENGCSFSLGSVANFLFTNQNWLIEKIERVEPHKIKKLGEIQKILADFDVLSYKHLNFQPTYKAIMETQQRVLAVMKAKEDGLVIDMTQFVPDSAVFPTPPQSQTGPQNVLDQTKPHERVREIAHS